jgi:hypothetical protein
MLDIIDVETEETVCLPLIKEQETSGASSWLRTAKLRRCLNEIAWEVSAALEEAALAMPIFISVPSGGALLTFCTPGDPSDKAWEKVTEIMCAIPVVQDCSGRG